MRELWCRSRKIKEFRNAESSEDFVWSPKTGAFGFSLSWHSFRFAVAVHLLESRLCPTAINCYVIGFIFFDAIYESEPWCLPSSRSLSFAKEFVVFYHTWEGGCYVGLWLYKTRPIYLANMWRVQSFQSSLEGSGHVGNKLLSLTFWCQLNIVSAVECIEWLCDCRS